MQHFVHDYPTVLFIARMVSGSSFPSAQDRNPPKSTQVLVRALRDCGAVMTSKGVTELRKDQSIKLFAIDAEPLIRKGWVAPVDEREG